MDLFIDVVNSNAFDIPEHYAFLSEPTKHAKKSWKKKTYYSRPKFALFGIK